MSYPFDVKTFDDILANSSPDGKVLKLSCSYNKILNIHTAHLLTKYILKHHNLQIGVKNSKDADNYNLLKYLLSLKSLSEVSIWLKNSVLAGDVEFSFSTPFGLCTIYSDDLFNLSKFLDMNGQVENVPEINIKDINKYLYDNNLKCLTTNQLGQFLNLYVDHL